MNKILLISISLLVLFAAVAGASAANVDGAVDCNGTCVVEGDADDVVEIDSVAVDADDVNETACADVKPAHDMTDAVDDIAEVENEANAVAENDGSANLEIHHFNKYSPDFIGGITKEKMDSLKEDIDKYTTHYKKNRYVQLTDDSNGPRYDVFELILDVYKNHSYDDTVIIVSKALRNCGLRYFEIHVEDMMNEMRSGNCFVDHNNFDADHYKQAINAIESRRGNDIAGINAFHP